MNKSKKAIKGSKKANKKQFTVNPIVWIVAGAILGLALIIGIMIDQLYKRPLVTIDGNKYYLEDMTYQFYNAEASYDYINQLYGGTYWDTPYSEGSDMTVRDYAKLETINNFIFEEVLYKEALAKGYTLTQEETDKIKENIDVMLNDTGLSEKFLKKNGFTEDFLKNVFTKNTLASRYKQDVIDSFEINDEEIKAGIVYEDYRQYEIEYLYISTLKRDEEDNSQVSMNKVEKKVALDKITAMREKALDTEDWSSLIPEDEKDLKYRTNSLMATDVTFSDTIMDKILAMENNEISDVIDDEDAYYVIRMKNNNSPKAYDTAVANAIKEKEEAAFSEEYTKNILPKYTIELNNNAVRNLRMGRITLVD
jgi:foldase protein PrsA